MNSQTYLESKKHLKSYFYYGVILFFIFFIPLSLSLGISSYFSRSMIKLATVIAVFLAINGAWGESVIERSTKKWFHFPNYVYVPLFTTLILSIVSQTCYFLLFFHILSYNSIVADYLPCFPFFLLIPLLIIAYIEMTIIKKQVKTGKHPFLYLIIFSIALSAIYWGVYFFWFLPPT